ncbi:hypothetical protein PI95_010630 [Hassallia byssoidea VB512170]|uniref:Uncharacterized protein n=1 Tax=Hassallia byssoidea VB512170 TaxID=1304833 RepID=A0A846H8R3_9CYAN|nr:hypothetical protein [Hassalia byssoidea]NEU73000.1 hypothetical protein [Hassalia byssoidea VB512170]
MGNGEWGMGNGEWGMGSGEWGMANYQLPITNYQFPMPNSQCPIKQGVNLVLSFLWFLYFTLDNNATNPVPETLP